MLRQGQSVDRFATTRSLYAEHGLGRRLRPGARPALVVVDLSNAFTDPNHELGMPADAIVDATCEVLDAMRRSNHFVVFLTVAFAEGVEHTVLSEKAPAMKALRPGTRDIEIDSRLGRRADEPLIAKQAFSGFLGTSLASVLVGNQIDTVLLAGVTTSGCVRATATDAISLGFRSFVIADCCGDRSEVVHESNLFDLDQKFSDVVSKSQALEYLGTLPARR